MTNVFKNCDNIYELERSFDQLTKYETVRNCTAVDAMEEYCNRIIADYREKKAEIEKETASQTD